MTDISFVPFVSAMPATITAPEPTAVLRWRADKLEQKWIVSEIDNGTVVSRTEEWRVVPTADLDDSPNWCDWRP